MELKVNTCKWPQVLGKHGSPSHYLFCFTYDWLRWRKLSRPITEHSETKTMQLEITFDTQLKIGL